MVNINTNDIKEIEKVNIRNPVMGFFRNIICIISITDECLFIAL
tara:strand:- start:1481 stop:1612 length:132 start_codon:yes stop_codon:yes gene_type:complete